MNLRSKFRKVKAVIRDPRGLRRAAGLTVALQGDPWSAGYWFGRNLTEDQRRRFGLAVLAGDGIVATFTRDGFTWTTDVSNNGICQGLICNGGYQADDIAALIGWIRDARDGRPVIVDIGANVGTTSIPFALAGYEVVAIEPVPSTFEMLCSNVERNGLGDKIRCVNRAVSSSNTVRMNLTGSSGNNEVAGKHQPGYLSEGLRTRGTIDVVGEGLAHILGRLGIDRTSVALVWSDTQGSEADVVKTGSPLWPLVPLYVEFWPEGLAAHDGVEDFISLLGTHFAEFATCGSLTSRRPIAELRDLELTSSPHTDLLLLSHELSART